MSSPQHLTTAVAAPEAEIPWPAGTMLQVFATSRAPDVLQLRLVGELDLANAAELARATRQHLAPEHHTLRLHLARLRFCDCAGLRAIVNLHNRMLQRRGSLRLVQVSAPVRRLLSLTELDGALHVH